MNALLLRFDFHIFLVQEKTIYLYFSLIIDTIFLKNLTCGTIGDYLNLFYFYRSKAIFYQNLQTLKINEEILGPSPIQNYNAYLLALLILMFY